MFSLSLCYVSRLVATDYHFQAIYDVAMIQVLIFNLYVLIRDSYKAGRYVPRPPLYLQSVLFWGRR